MANPNRLNPADHLSQRNLLNFFAISAVALLGLAGCVPSAKDVARELATIQAAAIQTPLPPYLATATPSPTKSEPSKTPTPTLTPRPLSTEIPLTCNLYEYFARDIIQANPQLSVPKIAAQLETIAEKIPENVPFQAEACKGLIPHPATGGVVMDKVPIFRNAPEGGYAYISTGHINVDENGRNHQYPWKKNNVYLVFVMGRPDDFSPKDLNTTIKLLDFPAGHIYVNYVNQAVPAKGQEFSQRKIVDRAWFAQQLWWAAQSGSNCGVGCEYTITVDFIDAQTGKEYIYQVNPKTFEWTQITGDQLRSQLRQQEADQSAMITGRNPSRITRPLNPRADKNPFKGIRI